MSRSGKSKGVPETREVQYSPHLTEREKRYMKKREAWDLPKIKGEVLKEVVAGKIKKIRKSKEFISPVELQGHIYLDPVLCKKMGNLKDWAMMLHHFNEAVKNFEDESLMVDDVKKFIRERNGESEKDTVSVLIDLILFLKNDEVGKLFLFNTSAFAICLVAAYITSYWMGLMLVPLLFLAIYALILAPKLL